MSYTLLRVVPEGVVLYAEHRARLAPAGARVLSEYDRFASAAAPGIYALRAGSDMLAVLPRDASRLFDGIPVRFAISPFAGQRGGPFPKPPSPSRYDAVRVPGASTLLTSRDGSEIYEGCAAAVVGWDGAQVVLAPADRPQVDSTALRAVRGSMACAFQPLPVQSDMPLVLVNAIVGVCLPSIEGRPVFPSDVRKKLESALAETTRRP